MADIVSELRQQVGVETILDSASVSMRARNYWDSTPLKALALARPRTTDELSRILSVCHAHGQTVVAHGGLTGVCDGDRSTAGDVIVSLERMSAIDEIDVVGRTATVQSGCRLQHLQQAVEQLGLFLPLDLGARGSCTLGGNVATNAGGLNVIRFGMTRGMVLGLEAVLPDGTVISSMNRLLKNNSGYDLKQLFIGSEGTLGIVTRVLLALKERLPSTNTALVTIDHAEHLPTLLREMDRRLGGTVSSFEAMWGDYYREVTAPGGHHSPLGRQHSFYVIVEARGPDPVEDEHRFQAAVEAALQGGLIVDAVLPKSETERENIWKIRENFEALYRYEPLFLYDVGVPLRNMLEYVEGVRNDLKERWPNSRFFVLGHIGDGNLHFFVAPEVKGSNVNELHAATDDIVYRPLAHIGGTVSAEHGIGLEKKAWLLVSRSRAEIELMKTLKRALDPKCILNPGKVIDL